MSHKINNLDTSLSFRSVLFPDLQMCVEIFCTKLQSPVWSRHVGVPPRDTDMATGKYFKHLQLKNSFSLAIVSNKK